MEWNGWRRGFLQGKKLGGKKGVVLTRWEHNGLGGGRLISQLERHFPAHFATIPPHVLWIDCCLMYASVLDEYMMKV